MKTWRFACIVLAVAIIAGCSSNPPQQPQGSEPAPRSAEWDRSFGGVDKSYDTELLNLRAAIAPRFKTLSFVDPVTQQSMAYNLFVPDGERPRDGYPLVLFMADASTTGKGPLAPLMQGYGGIVWATPRHQSQHPCFVLVPAFSGPENAVNDRWEVSAEVGVARRLLDDIVERYPVDRNRLYTTGQSMGGMISFYLNATEPNLFAASIFVGSQWNVAVLQPLARQKFFYIVSAGDQKASGGMRDLGELLRGEGVSVGDVEFAANLPRAEQEQLLRGLIEQRHDINFVRFAPNTVQPATASGPGAEHMYSFDHAYQLESVREWLFRQAKPRE